jgi:hypothetical protein
MKGIYRLFLPLACSLLVAAANAQCVISSSNGYQVRVSITPRTVVVSSTDCPWGYNYNLTYDYDVTFTGSNIPSALYTLQTLIKCNGQVNGGYTMPLTGGSGTSTTTTNPAIPHTGTAYSYGSNPDCQHATVQTLHCNQIQLIIQGPGINYQTVSCNYTGGALPVELIDYTAGLSGNGVALNWSTASELRNDHFTVYKSADGQNWTKAATIAGAGTTTSYNSYVWTDETPGTGFNYYKLTQTDLDGTTTEQGIAAVEYIRPDESMTTVYPNPSLDGRFNVRVVSRTKSPVQVVLRDQLGRIVGETTLAETDTFGNRYILQDVVTAEAGSGFYIVEIVQDNELIGRHKVEAAGN